MKLKNFYLFIGFLFSGVAYAAETANLPEVVVIHLTQVVPAGTPLPENPDQCTWTCRGDVIQNCGKYYHACNQCANRRVSGGMFLGDEAMNHRPLILDTPKDVLLLANNRDEGISPLYSLIQNGGLDAEQVKFALTAITGAGQKGPVVFYTNQLGVYYAHGVTKIDDLLGMLNAKEAGIGRELITKVILLPLQ